MGCVCGSWSDGFRGNGLWPLHSRGGHYTGTPSPATNPPTLTRNFMRAHAHTHTHTHQVKLHEAQEAALKEALREAERAATRVAKGGSAVDMEYLKNTVIKVSDALGETREKSSESCLHAACCEPRTGVRARAHACLRALDAWISPS